MNIAGIYFIPALLILPLMASGQAEEEGPEPMKLEKKKSWTSLVSKKGVDVQYKYAECHDNKNDVHKENVLLRFKNSNQESVTVEWDHLLWYDGKCKTCGKGDEYHFKLDLEAGETQKGTCDRGASQSVQVFASYLKSGNGLPDTELTGIRLADLEVQ